MTTTPYPIDQFGGLDLLRDPTEIGAAGATALSDVALDLPGRIRTRDGYEVFATTTTAPQRVHVYSSNAPPFDHLVSSSDTKLEVFDVSSGSAVASGTVTPGFGPHAMVTYGKSSSSAVYATHQQDSAIRKWSGSAWSTVASSPRGTGLAVSRASNRLVVGGISGDKVQFSDAGDPETFGANNFVLLSPNDGDFITQVQSFQDYVIVFKRRSFYTFYGESIDSDGNPIFNYRATMGIGALQGVGTAVSTPRGVYFLAYDGLWLTTGGAPVRVDGPLAPLFGSGLTAQNLALSTSVSHHLAWHKDRLLVVLSDGSSATVYVYYPLTDAWAQWSMQANKDGGGFTGSPLDTSLWFVNGVDSSIYRMLPSLTTDAGSAINWNYTSGLYSPAGDRGRVAISLESQLIGSGAVTLQVATTGGAGSSSGAFDTGSAVTLGTAPAVAEGWQQIDREGALWQHKLSGSGAAMVAGLSHYLGFVRPSGSW